MKPKEGKTKQVQLRRGEKRGSKSNVGFISSDNQRSIPVLVVALSDHNHFISTDTAFEKTPLTISAKINKQKGKRIHLSSAMIEERLILKKHKQIEFKVLTCW